jgi:hypothetical protein
MHMTNLANQLLSQIEPCCDDLSSLLLKNGGKQMVIMPVRFEGIAPTPSPQPSPKPTAASVETPSQGRVRAPHSRRRPRGLHNRHVGLREWKYSGGVALVFVVGHHSGGGRWDCWAGHQGSSTALNPRPNLHYVDNNGSARL